jgi:hypothetical protein
MTDYVKAREKKTEAGQSKQSRISFVHQQAAAEAAGLEPINW